MRSHTDHQSRLDWWRRQIQRQPKTNLTIADFCRQLGVSVPTFYYWKRRVQEGPGTPFGRIPGDHPSPHPTTPIAAAPAQFVPVSIVDPDAGTHLEIEFANTCMVRLRGPLSPRSLRAAITAAGRLDGSRQGGH
jgi:transposase-like protein